MRLLQRIAGCFLATLAVSAAGLGFQGDLAAGDPSQAAAPTAPAEVLMIRLRGGDIHWGSIVDHSEEALVFARLDTGGHVALPWSFLDPDQDLELRTRFGYVELGGEEVLIAAEMLVLVDGQEIIGRVTGRTDEAVLFKSGGLTLAIPKTRIQSHVAGLQVPALDIYTKEELYADELLRADAESAESQFALAEFCERIFDFPHALEHYEAAATLDENFMVKELVILIERARVKVDSQEQVDYLANVDHLSRRKNYEGALQALAAFDGTYPESPLITDRLKLEERVLKARNKHMQREIPKRWFAWMGRLGAKAGREMAYAEALAYLEEGYADEIVLNVTNEMRRSWPDIEEDQVRQFFIERKRGRWKPASYGPGTWLLGEEDALKGGNAGLEQAEPESARDAERADMEAKINRFMRNQQMAKRNSKSADDEEEIEDFWKTMSSSARRYWIIAYYAENAGQVDVRDKPELHNCSECGGTGAREVIYTGSAREGATSGMRLVTCRACRGIGRTRRIRYR